MIIRVLRVHVSGVNVARFNLLFRSQVALLKEQPGLEYVKLARRLERDGGEEVLLFEEWRSPADMYRWVGPDPAEARLIQGTRELIDRFEVAHYEALDREVGELSVGSLELDGTAAAADGVG